MIFCYWTNAEPPFNHSIPAEGVAEWKSRFPSFKVFSDDDVLPLLDEWGSEASHTFKSIRIPSCKSDVARLVLLYNFGGLYVDTHCGPGQPYQLTCLFDRLSNHELVLFDESVNSPEYVQTCIINGVLCARAKSDILETLIRLALSNLYRHRTIEAAGSEIRPAYSIYKLTGPWMIWHELFQHARLGGELKAQYRNRVSIWAYEAEPSRRPVCTDKYGKYRTAESHWSRREQKEPLFSIDCGLEPASHRAEPNDFEVRKTKAEEP